MRAYRDPEIALPTAKTAIKPGSDRAPKGDLCIINIRRDGSIWTRRGTTPTTLEELPRLISEAHAAKGCLVVRCDKNARWRHVTPVLTIAVRADVPSLWFSVDGDGECLVGYQFPEAPVYGDAVLRSECWVRIKTMGNEDVGSTPWIAVDQCPLKDWDQLLVRLRRYASVPGVKDDLIVLDADGDAFFGWVMRALDCVREFGFHDIAFCGVEGSPAPLPESVEEEDLTIPIEEVPVRPEAESSK